MVYKIILKRKGAKHALCNREVDGKAGCGDIDWTPPVMDPKDPPEMQALVRSTWKRHDDRQELEQSRKIEELRELEARNQKRAERLVDGYRRAICLAQRLRGRKVVQRHLRALETMSLPASSLDVIWRLTQDSTMVLEERKRRLNQRLQRGSEHVDHLFS